MPSDLESTERENMKMCWAKGQTNSWAISFYLQNTEISTDMYFIPIWSSLHCDPKSNESINSRTLKTDWKKQRKKLKKNMGQY